MASTWQSSAAAPGSVIGELGMGIDDHGGGNHMSAQENRRWKLMKRPQGTAKRSDFQLETAPVPEPAAGEVVVQVEYISLDPAMRGWMNEGKSYAPPVGLGEVMRALGAGRVVASNDPS